MKESISQATLYRGLKMPSFDIVSKVDLQEVDNAVNQAVKEISQRYDFKGTTNEVEIENNSLRILAADESSFRRSRIF